MSLQDLKKKYPVVTRKTFSVSLQGLEGTGKTYFILATMPLPVVMVNFGDRSPAALLEKLPEERREQITVFDLQPRTEAGWTLPEAQRALQALGEIVMTAVPEIKGGTFAIDSASRWWRAMQVALVEPKERERLAKGLKSMGGLIYEEANLRFDGIMSWLKAQDVYVAVTHVLKQDWDAEGPIPGSYSPRQNSQIPFIVEVQLELRKVCLVCRQPLCAEHAGRIHQGRILKMATNTLVEGTVIDDPSFDKIESLYFA